MPVVPYFVPSVVDVVGPFLEDAGLSRLEVDAVGATWDAGSSILRFSYYPEDAPNFSVHVAVAGKTEDEAPQWVGLWKAIPESAPARAYTSWSFHSEVELRSVLGKLVAEVLAEHGPSLWGDESHLASLVAVQDAETQRRFMVDEVEAQLALARWSFDNDRFAEARDRFALIGEDQLSAGDRRRLYVARTKAGAGE